MSILVKKFVAKLSRGLAPAVALAIVAGGLTVAQPVIAGEVFSVIPGMGFSRTTVTSIKEARFNKVVKQQYDFSCGSAALATLLSYHYDYAVGEKAVLDTMIEQGDQEKIRTQGFSLLDMKRYLESAGFTANGYKAPLDKLNEAKIPAIVLINLRGYLHFVVVKGLHEDEVLVGDPALGMRTYPREEFDKMWNGILFVVISDIETAQSSYNNDDAWLVRHKAPFGSALSTRSLASVTLLAPGANQF